VSTFILYFSSFKLVHPSYISHGALQISCLLTDFIYYNRNILRDDTGHLKVADFDLCKMLKWRRKIREERAITSPGNACKQILFVSYTKSGKVVLILCSTIILILQVDM
jgi:hypothetical protein